MSNRIYYVLLGIILVVACLVRLYRFDTPLADWHSWRQTDTSAVSRMFVQNGFDILHPTFNDLSNIPSGQDNPYGYRFVEFPIFNIFQAVGYSTFPVVTIEQWGRLVTIGASLISIALLFFIGKRFVDSLTGLVASLLFAILPYSIYYSRTVLPDQLMVTFTLASFYFFVQWIDHKKERISWLWYVLTLVTMACALLVKPYAIFFMLPHIYFAFRELGIRMIKNPLLWILALGALIPFALWRYWMLAYPEGIPASDWLFNGGDIRFKGAYFHWIYGERIAKLILGYFGVVLLFMGLLRTKSDRWYGIFATFLLSSFLYLSVIARGNVQHDYYQILIIPTICLLCARGVRFLLSQSKESGKYFVLIMTVVIGALMIPLSWYHVRDYFNINNPTMVEAGKQADAVLPRDAKVIAPYGGDTTFLYYVNRQGWPAFQHSAEELAEKGATHLVLSNPSEQDILELPQKYEVVASSGALLIVKIK